MRQGLPVPAVHDNPSICLAGGETSRGYRDDVHVGIVQCVELIPELMYAAQSELVGDLGCSAKAIVCDRRLDVARSDLSELDLGFCYCRRCEIPPGWGSRGRRDYDVDIWCR